MVWLMSIVTYLVVGFAMSYPILEWYQKEKGKKLSFEMFCVLQLTIAIFWLPVTLLGIYRGIKDYANRS